MKTASTTSSPAWLKPFVLGFAACGFLSLIVAAGPAWHAREPVDPAVSAPPAKEARPQADPGLPRGKSSGGAIARGEAGDEQPGCDLPQCVIDALCEEACEFRVESVDADDFEGTTLFSIYGHDSDGSALSFVVSRMGTILQTGESADKGDLPAELTATIEREMPGALITEAGVIRTITFYATITMDGRNYTAIFSSGDGLSIDESEGDDDANDGDAAAMPMAPGGPIPDAEGDDDDENDMTPA
jgi:hypothetical protein